MVNNEEEKEVIYDGFATPSLILQGSDKDNRGMIVDQYAKTKEQDGLLCGSWSRGFQDGLIHIRLMKPVAAMCDERFGWVNKNVLLKEPISYMTPNNTKGETIPKKTITPKQKVVFDPVTKQFHLEI